MNIEKTKICLIINPKSGVSRRGIGVKPCEEVINFFNEKGLSVTIKSTNKEGAGVELAKESAKQKYTHVIAFGGDGTINEVINGISGTEAVLGVLPLGTENTFCRTMGVPLNIREACSHFWEAEERDFDVGVVNDRRFLIMSGIGLDARVISEMDRETKNRLGTLGYIVKGAVKVLFGENNKMVSDTVIKFKDKDEEYRGKTWLIAVGNLPNYSSNVRVFKEADPKDGKLDVKILEYSEKISMQQQVIKVVSGSHDDIPSIKYFRTESFEVETDPPVYCQVDGELLGKTPLKYSAEKKALRVRI